MGPIARKEALLSYDHHQRKDIQKLAADYVLPKLESHLAIWRERMVNAQVPYRFNILFKQSNDYPAHYYYGLDQLMVNRHFSFIPFEQKQDVKDFKIERKVIRAAELAFVKQMLDTVIKHLNTFQPVWAKENLVDYTLNHHLNQFEMVQVEVYIKKSKEPPQITQEELLRKPGCLIM